MVVNWLNAVVVMYDNYETFPSGRPSTTVYPTILDDYYIPRIIQPNDQGIYQISSSVLFCLWL